VRGVSLRLAAPRRVSAVKKTEGIKNGSAKLIFTYTENYKNSKK
jgi:hypothetical protein